MTPIKLIVGLGNPGPEYAATRHNAGFWWVDRLAGQYRSTLSADAKFHGRVGRANHAGHSFWLLEPLTYMNGSGKAVGALAHFYRIAPEEVLVVHDELDLPPGVARLKQGGGHGGHNGLKDIVAHFGDADFWRLRIGIGHPGDKSAVVGYVLQRPSVDEEPQILQAIDKSLALAAQLMMGEMGAAMLKLHTKD